MGAGKAPPAARVGETQSLLQLLRGKGEIVGRWGQTRVKVWGAGKALPPLPLSSPVPLSLPPAPLLPNCPIPYPPAPRLPLTLAPVLPPTPFLPPPPQSTTYLVECAAPVLPPSPPLRLPPFASPPTLLAPRPCPLSLPTPLPSPPPTGRSHRSHPVHSVPPSPPLRSPPFSLLVPAPSPCHPLPPALHLLHLPG